MPESGPGQIFLFEEFAGAEKAVVDTTNDANIGFLTAVGEGIEDNDAGVVKQDSDGLNGVVRVISGNDDKDTTGLVTGRMFDVALMGTIVVEARVRLGDLDDKQVFMGLCDVNGPNLDMETDLIEGSTATITFAGSADCAGFFFSSTLNDDEDWHGVHAGGTTANSTVSTTVDLDDDAIAGEWQVLRLEATVDGTVRWYIDGVLLQTVVGALSITTDLNFLFAASANTTQLAEADVDYIMISAGRDWTV